MDWCLRVYKKDMRYKSGERMVNEYHYPDWTRGEMANEVSDLRSTCYKPADGWRLEFHEAWVTVKNMMTGQDITIRAADKGGVCDPSQERYWTM